MHAGAPRIHPIPYPLHLYPAPCPGQNLLHSSAKPSQDKDLRNVFHHFIRENFSIIAVQLCRYRIHKENPIHIHYFSGQISDSNISKGIHVLCQIKHVIFIKPDMRCWRDLYSYTLSSVNDDCFFYLPTGLQDTPLMMQRLPPDDPLVILTGFIPYINCNDLVMFHYPNPGNQQCL